MDFIYLELLIQLCCISFSSVIAICVFCCRLSNYGSVKTYVSGKLSLPNFQDLCTIYSNIYKTFLVLVKLNY